MKVLLMNLITEDVLKNINKIYKIDNIYFDQKTTFLMSNVYTFFEYISESVKKKVNIEKNFANNFDQIIKIYSNFIKSNKYDYDYTFLLYGYIIFFVASKFNINFDVLEDYIFKGNKLNRRYLYKNIKKGMFILSSDEYKILELAIRKTSLYPDCYNILKKASNLVYLSAKTKYSNILFKIYNKVILIFNRIKIKNTNFSIKVSESNFQTIYDLIVKYSQELIDIVSGNLFLNKNKDYRNLIQELDEQIKVL